MDSHDRTFLELTHTLLVLVVGSLALIGTGWLGLTLASDVLDRVLFALLVGGLGALVLHSGSRLLYRLSGFAPDDAHSRRSLRRGLWLIGVSVVFALVLSALAALVGLKPPA